MQACFNSKNEQLNYQNHSQLKADSYSEGKVPPFQLGRHIRSSSSSVKDQAEHIFHWTLCPPEWLLTNECHAR